MTSDPEIGLNFEDACPHEVFVVACRPYAEKVLGARTKDGLTADGMFFHDENSARIHADHANRRMAAALMPPAFYVYRALLTIEKTQR